jgi:hypothetical protein
MSPKQNQITLIRRMDARVEALEGEIAGIKATLSSMEQGQATLIAMLS